MSIEVMTLVWRADLPAMDKIVLLRLADFADAHGRNVYPSVERVQKECGVSERHARAVIKKFTTDGLLVLVRQGGGRNRPAEYRFDLEALKRCTPCRVLDLSDAENPAPGAPIPDQKGAPGAEKGAPRAENPAPGAPNPSVTIINRHAAVADASEGNADLPSPHTVGRRVLELMGVFDDPRWFGNYGRVHQWLADGADPEADIYPTITRLMRARSGEPPRSLKYFDAAVADAVRQRTSPMTTPTGGPTYGNRTHHDTRPRNGFVDAARKEAARLGAGGPDDHG